MPYDAAPNPFESPQTVEPKGPAPRNNRGPEGIGGWLILVAIGLVITPIRALFMLITTHLPLFSGEQFSILTNPQSGAYHPLWAPLLLFEVAGNLVICVAAVTALVLMFRTSRFFPRWMMGYYVVGLAFVASDTLLGNLIPAVAEVNGPDQWNEVFKGLVAALIWVPYMCVSQRVKNTFVH